MHEEKKHLVPRLRFPEFRDAGPWEVKRLGAALDYEQPGPFIVRTEQYSESGTPVLTAGKTFILGYTHEAIGIYVKVPVIIFDDFTTESKFVDFPFKVKSSAIKILSARPGYSLKFMHEAMSLIKFDAFQHKRYWIAEFQHLQIPVPSLAEQQKIADCLSSLDEVIELETRKLEALKAHKRGLMQQLFPREGETTPRLRFPEFRNAGPWEVKHGNDLFMQISNKEHNGNLPVLAITQEHGAIPRELIDYHISVTEQSVKSYKVVEVGDFIISLRTFQGGIEYSRYKGICSPAYVILRKSDNAIVDDFYRHYFKTGKFIADLNKNLEGLRDGKLVSFRQFSEIKLPLPPIAEQQKIADCLSSLDEVIELQARKLEALKAHKKGLLQQLFPQEVTP